MKFAIPLEEGVLAVHFGHSQEFLIGTVDALAKTWSSIEKVAPPPHEPGVLPSWLQTKGVELVFAGGMGAKAVQLLQQNHIQVLTGCPSVVPEILMQNYLAGAELNVGNFCDHGPEHRECNHP